MRAFKKVIIFSGAGLSAESGIQTFRDTNGLWNDYKISEVCSIYTWKTNYELVHEFYSKRRVELGTVTYNAAHKAIAEFKNKYTDKVVILTQNVDDLLERAGCEDVVHLHGELRKIYCFSCGRITDIGYTSFTAMSDACLCGCKRAIKPYVVFFGEQAPEYKKLYKHMNALDEDTLLLVIGTMGNVVQIREWIGRESRDGESFKNTSAYTILNNMDESEFLKKEYFDEVHYGKCTDIVPEILSKIEIKL